MQPTDSAFDRVKSLLGKMDRSIDEARQRRLDNETPDDDSPSGVNRRQPLTESDHESNDPSSNGTNGNGHADGASPGRHAEAARPTSKYGRATPIRETPPPNTPTWRRA